MMRLSKIQVIFSKKNFKFHSVNLFDTLTHLRINSFVLNFNYVLVSAFEQH